MTRPEHLRPVNSVEAYHQAFVHTDRVSVNGLCGRVIRGKKPADYDHLTDDPNRKIVMLMGPDGLEQLPGNSGYDALRLLGYTTEHIASRVNAGYKFKLAVFQEGREARPATWDNVTALAGATYPDTQRALERHLDNLKTVPFTDIENAAGFSFAEVDHNGINDPRYMTHERFMQSRQDLIATRAFHYFTLHLRELYSGDGYTYDHNGKRGVMEYIILNKPIHELGKHALINVDVSLPSNAQ